MVTYLKQMMRDGKYCILMQLRGLQHMAVNLDSKSHAKIIISDTH